ncbi:MAG: GNAT family N-acetyltransferase [Anaerolineae bacterium]
MLWLRRVAKLEPELLTGLAQLLIDSVAGGASVGFLPPLSMSTATRYWESIFASLGPGLILWIAEQDDRIVGTVQLAPVLKENGRHRAEVQKLLVHIAYRGQGIASQLMRELETVARRDGRTLLVLDTLTDSAAEKVYQHLGWTRQGEIPNYARIEDGTLHATTIYYKILPPEV